MANIPGFELDYECISDGEAFQRNHEYGDNFIDVKALKEVRDLKKLIGSYAKVFRNGVIKRIEVEKVTIGDFVIVEKGDIIPADAVVIESKDFAVLSITDNKVVEDNLVNKDIYQGMKVLSGKATVMVAKIGKDTYLAKKLNELIEHNKSNTFSNKVLKNGVIFLIISAVLFFITAIIGLIRFWGTDELYKSVAHAGILLIAFLPVELIFMTLIINLGIKKRLKGNKIELKNPFSLVDMDKAKVICVYDDFFSSKNVNDMQRLYRAGIRVIMLSSKPVEDAKKLALESGLTSGSDIKVVTGNELKQMSYSDLRKTSLEVIVYAEMDSESNELIAKSLKSMGVPFVMTGSKIDDVISLKSADMGICVSAKRDNLESRIADGFIKELDIKVIIEMLRVARKFKDALKKAVRHVVATRVPIFVITLLAIIFNNNSYLYTIDIIIIYWIINTLVAWAVGTLNGNEVILNVDAKKNIFTLKDTSLLILKTIIFTALLAVVFFGLGYLSVDESIISYSLLGSIILGCVLIALTGRNRVKEKILKSEMPKKEKVKEVKPKEPKPEKKVLKKEDKKEKEEEKPKFHLSSEKPWVSEEDLKKEEEKKALEEAKKKAEKVNFKNKKQKRAEELKGKML